MKYNFKFVALLLTLSILLVFTASACGSSDNTTAETAETAAETTVAEDSDVEETQDETESEIESEEIDSNEEETVESEEDTAEEDTSDEESSEERPANSLPLTENGETLTMFASTNSNVTDVIGELGNHQIYQEAEELTGVHIDFKAYTMESADTNFSLMLVSGDLTDLIRYAATGYPNGIAGALEQEQIVNLTDYMEEYAPSYSYILASDEQINLDARTDDGDVVGFYRIRSEAGSYDVSIAHGPMIRKDLLDDLGMDIPSTNEELTEVLLAFKTEFDLSDPIWLGNSGFSDDSALIGAFDTTNDFYQIDGVIHYGPLDDSFLDYLTMMHEWYEAGILNRDFISYDDNPNSADNEGLKYSGQAGMHYSSATDMDNYNDGNTSGDDDFLLVGIPYIAGADGINHFGQDTFSVQAMGCMTVTTSCENVELAVMWCDFWYSDVGSLLSNYGIEGQTFEYDEEGEPHWTEFVTNNPDGLSYVVCRQVYLALTQQPGIYNMNAELEMLSDNGKAAIETWNSSADGAYLITDCYSMTAEESEELSALLSDINTLNDESWIKFITGDKSLDEYDEYVEQLKSMNIDRAIEIYQDALDRYYAR